MRILAIVTMLVGVVGVLASIVWHPAPACRIYEVLHPESAAVRYCRRTPAELEQLANRFARSRQNLQRRISLLERAFEADMGRLTEGERARREEAMIAEPPELQRTRTELRHLLIEEEGIAEARRLQAIPVLPIVLAFLAVGGGLWWLGGRRRGRQVSAKPPKAFVRNLEVREEELWLSPDRAELRRATLIANRAAVVAEAWAQRPKRCAYCEVPLPPTPAGTLVHVRIYKEVPADVTAPKPILLAEGWSFEPAEAIACAACGHVHRA